jgi:hypothetical protein
VRIQVLSAVLAELLGDLRDAHGPPARHVDPLRAALAFFIGLPLDFAPRLELEPASVTRLELTLDGAKLVQLNLNVAAGAPKS